MENDPSSAATRWARGFWALVVTQFQGAFSDNAYRFLLIFMFAAASASAPREREFLVLVVGALFSFPFVLFSMAGGYLADRFSKRTVTVGTKIAEIIVTHRSNHFQRLAPAYAFRLGPLQGIRHVELPDVPSPRVIDPVVMAIGDCVKSPALGDQRVLAPCTICSLPDVRAASLLRRDIGQVQQERAWHTGPLRFHHRFSAGEVRHIRIAGAIHDDLRTDRCQALLGSHNHTRNSIAFHQRVHGRQVRKDVRRCCSLPPTQSRIEG